MRTITTGISKPAGKIHLVDRETDWVYVSRCGIRFRRNEEPIIFDSVLDEPLNQVYCRNCFKSYK